MCTFECCHSPFAFKNTSPHILQVEVLSPTCRLLMCLLRLPAKENAALHWLQMLGFSPVWVLKCLLISHASINAWPHCLHLMCLSPVWVFVCLFNMLGWENSAPQMLHLDCWSVFCQASVQKFPRGHIVHWNYISISKHNTWWMVMVLSERGWYWWYLI